MRGCPRVGTTRGIRGGNSVGTRGRALGRTTVSASPSLAASMIRMHTRGILARGAREYRIPAPAPRVVAPVHDGGTHVILD